MDPQIIRWLFERPRECYLSVMTNEFANMVKSLYVNTETWNGINLHSDVIKCVYLCESILKSVKKFTFLYASTFFEVMPRQ